MLAYYVEWHMRACLKPMLFDDEFIEKTQAARLTSQQGAAPHGHVAAVLGSDRDAGG